MNKAPWPGTAGGYQPGRVAADMIAFANAPHNRFTPKKQEHLAGDGKVQYPVKNK